MSKYERSKVNPFINDELIKDAKDKRVRIGLKKDDTKLIDNNTGEVMQVYGYVHTKVLVDSSKFIKIYINNLETIFNLQKAGKKILEYICINLGIGKDYIEIDLKECMFHCGYSRQSVYNGLENLQLAGIIARSESSIKWWINPTVLFNGNRMTIINEYIIKQKELVKIQIEEGTEEDRRLEQEFKNSNLNS